MTESRNKNGKPSLEAMSHAASEMRAPNLGEVKSSIRVRVFLPHFRSEPTFFFPG